MKCLAYHDFDLERTWYPWHSHWWYYQSFRFVFGPIFRVLRHRLNIWHKDEGESYWKGRLVTPATWWRFHADLPHSLKASFLPDKRLFCSKWGIGEGPSIWPRRWIARWLGVA